MTSRSGPLFVRSVVAVLLLLNELSVYFDCISRAPVNYSRLWRLCNGTLVPAGQNAWEVFWGYLCFASPAVYPLTMIAALVCYLVWPKQSVVIGICIVALTLVKAVIGNVVFYDYFTSMDGTSYRDLSFSLAISVVPVALLFAITANHSRVNASLFALGRVVHGLSYVVVLRLLGEAAWWLLYMVMDEALRWYWVGWAISLGGSLVGLWLFRGLSWLSLGVSIAMGSVLLFGLIQNGPDRWYILTQSGRVGSLLVLVVASAWLSRWKDPLNCRNCGYAIKHSGSDRCPECGSLLDAPSAHGERAASE